MSPIRLAGSFTSRRFTLVGILTTEIRGSSFLFWWWVKRLPFSSHHLPFFLRSARCQWNLEEQVPVIGRSAPKKAKIRNRSPIGAHDADQPEPDFFENSSTVRESSQSSRSMDHLRMSRHTSSTLVATKKCCCFTKFLSIWDSIVCAPHTHVAGKFMAI